MTDLTQPFYVERDGLRGVIMPMPDGQFNWMCRVIMTKTGTCETFDMARSHLMSELTFLSMVGDVVQADDVSAPATTAAVVPLHPYGAQDEY